MTPRSEEIVLERATKRVDKCDYIDAETICAIEEILRTNRKKRAQDFALLVSLISYRRAAFTLEQEIAYAMGEVAGMCRITQYDTGDDSMLCYGCDACGYGWHVSKNDKPFTYCPNCGREIVYPTIVIDELDEDGHIVWSDLIKSNKLCRDGDTICTKACRETDKPLSKWNPVDADDMPTYIGDKVIRESRWHKLFGTPEQTAQTLAELELDHFNWCYGTEGCEKCPYEFDRYGCYLPDGFSLLKWLQDDASQERENKRHVKN